MQILFINLPYYGHVVPTIGLVQELIQRNCEVTYLLPYDWENKVKESGAKFVGYQNHKQLAEQIKNAYAKAESIIENYDLVIYEQFFFLGKQLADKYHKPVVRIFTAPATNKQLMDEFISTGPLAIFKHKWIAKAFTKDIAKGKALTTDNWLDEIVSNPPELNLVYTLREFQPYQEQFSTENYKFLGPSIYSRKEEPFTFTKQHRHVVYISLGTIVTGKKSFYQKCIDTFKDQDIDVILAIGKTDINTFKNIPMNVHIYQTVPQIQVLQQSDLFITHGGMNSISEALVSKTPMLVIPFHSDQPSNAKCVERLGVGKRLEYSKISKEILLKNVQEILDSDEIQDNLVKVQEYIQASLGNTGGADAIVEYYIGTITK